MYKQVLDPVSHSLGLTAIFAVLPLLTLFVLLGGLRMKAHWASLIALGVAVVVAIAVYGMPFGQTLDAGAEGVAFGFFPIMWIVINALWIFHMTEKTGDFAVLRRAFSSVSSDQRVQVVIIAFCFGALLEALAGFGTPIAICSVMLVGVGFKPIKAVVLALVADTAPVAFGGIAIPITTLASVTGLPKEELSQMIGRQMLPLAILVPFILVYMVDGRRGLRDTWPAALVAGGRVRGRPVRHLQLHLP
jgi:lactate permease